MSYGFSKVLIDFLLYSSLKIYWLLHCLLTKEKDYYIYWSIKWASIGFHFVQKKMTMRSSPTDNATLIIYFFVNKKIMKQKLDDRLPDSVVVHHAKGKNISICK